MRNPAVDTYITNSAEFARPILKRLRALMHEACPTIEETIKWGVPHFEYKGVVAGMAAFKQHAAFGFWKQRLIKDPTGFFSKGESGMGGRKIRSVSELPSDAELAERHEDLRWPASFPSARPVMALDRVYARGARVAEVRAHASRAARRASDHLPVVAQVELD